MARSVLSEQASKRSITAGGEKYSALTRLRPAVPRLRCGRKSAATVAADKRGEFRHLRRRRSLADFVADREEISRRLYSDLRRLSNRIAVDAATDCRESYRLDFVFDREPQRIPITIRQNLRFGPFPAPSRRGRLYE
jgi:hypothetical protein